MGDARSDNGTSYAIFKRKAAPSLLVTTGHSVEYRAYHAEALCYKNSNDCSQTDNYKITWRLTEKEKRNAIGFSLKMAKVSYCLIVSGIPFRR